MSQPKISIIVPCYNLAQYLDEALQSVFDQTYTNWECIIVNDGSPDDTEYVANKWIAKDSRFVYLFKENGGVSSARNLGINKAKGVYVIPLDADNKLRPEFIKRSISFFYLNSNVDVVYGNMQLFGNENSKRKSKPFDMSEMVLNNYIDNCACFRKSIWETLGGYDVNMPIYGFEDWDLWLRMGVHGCKFQYVDEVLFDYRVRDNSLLSGAWENRELLIEYIFNKKELQFLLPLRECLTENRKLKQEPAFKDIFQVFKNKIKRRLKL